MISTAQVPSRIDCGFNCLDEQRCVSYNYEEGEKVFHDCELNSESKETRSSDLTERTNYSYYGLRKSVSDKFKVSVKENEVPTEKNSSRASIFATKASYISN